MSVLNISDISGNSASQAAAISSAGIVLILLIGRWYRRKAWKWLPDAFLVCLPYWAALSLRLGLTPVPVWMIVYLLVVLIFFFIFSLPTFSSTERLIATSNSDQTSDGKFNANDVYYINAWGQVLRNQARGLYLALPIALITLILYGILLYYCNRGFSKAALLYYLSHLALFFAGVPITLTAIYAKTESSDR